MLKKTRAPRRKGLRRTERRKFVLDDLRTFRYRHWLNHHSRCSWGPESLIPDKTMGFLATNGGLRTMDDLKTALPDWAFRDSIGAMVLARMEEADDRWYESQGQVNPNKVVKVVETKRQAADRYNANKREKRLKLREEQKMEENDRPVNLDVNFFVPGTRKFIDVPPEVPPSQQSPSPQSQSQSQSLAQSQSQSLPPSLPVQLPLSSSRTLNWQPPLSGLKPKAVRKPRAPRKPKPATSTSKTASSSRSKTSSTTHLADSSSTVRIEDQNALPIEQVPGQDQPTNPGIEDIPPTAAPEPGPSRPRPRPRPRTEITFDYHMRL